MERRARHPMDFAKAMDMSRCPRRREADARAGCCSTPASRPCSSSWVDPLAPGEVAAQGVVKTGDSVRVTADQMHQLSIAPVEPYPFRVQKFAIGQIAFNEDTSTVVADAVLRPRRPPDRQDRRPGEARRAAVRDRQPGSGAAAERLHRRRHGHEQGALAARARQDRARSGSSDLYEGKAAPLKEWQQAQAQLVGAQNDLRSAERHARGRARPTAHRRPHRGRDRRAGARRARSGARSPITAPIDGTVIARKVGPGPIRAQRCRRRPLFDRRPLDHVAEGATCPKTTFRSCASARRSRSGSAPCRTVCSRRASSLIGAASDAATRRVVVRSEIPNPDGALKSEMFASFKIATGDGEPAPAVPVEAVIREGEHAAVWVEEEPMLFRAPQGEDRHGAGGPGADSRGPRARRAGRRARRDLRGQRVASNDRGSASAVPCDAAVALICLLPVAAAAGADQLRGVPRRSATRRSPRSTSRPIPIRRRRSSRSSRSIPANRRRRWSATSRSRSRSPSPARRD